MMKMNGFDKVKNFLEEITDEHILFKEHFYERSLDRPITEDLVRRTIKNTGKILKIEEQLARKPTEKKYKLWLKLSSRYNLVLIITIEEKNLYIITAWNSDRKWQQKMQK
jgi:hypothetical protein